MLLTLTAFSNNNKVINLSLVDAIFFLICVKSDIS